MKPIALKEYVCNRCQHGWLPRILTVPKRCPRCKSPYWHTPRTRPIASQ